VFNGVAESCYLGAVGCLGRLGEFVVFVKAYIFSCVVVFMEAFVAVVGSKNRDVFYSVKCVEDRVVLGGCTTAGGKTAASFVCLRGFEVEWAKMAVGKGNCTAYSVLVDGGRVYGCGSRFAACFNLDGEVEWALFAKNYSFRDLIKLEDRLVLFDFLGRVVEVGFDGELFGYRAYGAGDLKLDFLKACRVGDSIVVVGNLVREREGRSVIDFAVYSFGPDLELEWARVFGTKGIDEVFYVCGDGERAYVCCRTEQEGRRIGVLAVSPSGEVEWATRIGGGDSIFSPRCIEVCGQKLLVAGNITAWIEGRYKVVPLCFFVLDKESGEVEGVYPALGTDYADVWGSSTSEESLLLAGYSSQHSFGKETGLVFCWPAGFKGVFKWAPGWQAIYVVEWSTEQGDWSICAKDLGVEYVEVEEVAEGKVKVKKWKPKVEVAKSASRP